MAQEYFERGAGILCHISSLPNRYGIGSLGKEAYDFTDILAKCGVKYWQVLPLVQTGFGDSPYQSVSCAAGNPYFIDLVDLRRQHLLTAKDLREAEMPGGDIDYGQLYERRYMTLRRAYARFDVSDPEFRKFEERGDFDGYAVFMSLKHRYGTSFDLFPDEYKFRREKETGEFRNRVYDGEYSFWIFLQYEFFRQWEKLKAYANSKGVKIIGDIPLYVAYDSSDVWENPDKFMLDACLSPVSVAGVPPDCFSDSGQLWGNPLYDWDAMREDGFSWWKNRMAASLRMYDIVRIDHFRGLDRYYSVPAGRDDAREGEWLPAPGQEMLTAAEEYTGGLSVIAEDLGVMDDGVMKLIKDTGYPTMKVLLFAFDGNPDNPYLPANIEENSVCYTGTHDNDTVLGTIEKMSDGEYAEFLGRLRPVLREQGISCRLSSARDCVWALCRLAYSTKSRIAVLPVQDWLCLGGESRMNTPSTSGTNWRFRLTSLPMAKDCARLKNCIRKTSR